MSGRSSRPKRVSGFILCCEVCALQLQATRKPPVRLGMIWSSPACILWHVPTQRGFQFHAVRMEGTPGNCSCSRPVHLQGSLAAGFLCWPALWHCWQWEGLFAHTCTSASSSVVQAHILGQVREKKKRCLIVVTVASTSCGLRLWCKIQARKAPKVAGNWAEYLARPLCGAGLWVEWSSAWRQMMHGRMLQSAHRWSVKTALPCLSLTVVLIGIGMNLTWSDG